MAPADDTALTTGASCVAGTRSACPGCGVLLAEAEGAAHPYFACSPACWALYGEVLAREYGDRAYFRVHQLTVDIYAVQHPGRPERRSIQSTALHLSPSVSSSTAAPTLPMAPSSTSGLPSDPASTGSIRRG